jgi:hypothetical protein
MSNSPDTAWPTDSGQFRIWLEFGCWVTLVLTSILYAVNGPAVSPDQLVVRTALVIAPAIGALGFRLYSWRR